MIDNFKQARELLNGLEKAVAEMEGQSSLKNVIEWFTETLRDLMNAFDEQREEILRLRAELESVTQLRVLQPGQVAVGRALIREAFTLLRSARYDITADKLEEILEIDELEREKDK